MRKHNLHTHTTYSDGDSKPERLIDEHANRQYEILGITDHAFKKKGKCIPENEILKYISHLRELKAKEKRLELKIGLEVDISTYNGTDPKDLPFNCLNCLDYILFEAEGLKRNERNYGVRSVADIRKRLKIPVGLAHYHYGNPGFFKGVCQVMNENDIFYELNTAQGMQFYHNPFDKEAVTELFKKYDIALTIGTDLHTLMSLNYDHGRIPPDYAFEYIGENGLRCHCLGL